MKQWLILGLAVLVVLALMASVVSWYGASMSKDAAAIAEAMAEIEEAQAAQEAAKAANTAAWGLATRSAMDGLLFLVVVGAVIGVGVLYLMGRYGYLPRRQPGQDVTYPRPLPGGRVRPYGRGDEQALQVVGTKKRVAGQNQALMLAALASMDEWQQDRFLRLREMVGDEMALQLVLGRQIMGGGVAGPNQLQGMLPPSYEVVDVDDDEFEW